MVIFSHGVEGINEAGMRQLVWRVAVIRNAHGALETFVLSGRTNLGLRRIYTDK